MAQHQCAINFKIALILLATVIISGCVTLDIANNANFTKEYIKAGDFTLTTYQKFTQPSKNLSIYIEGDGHAWQTKYRLSSDPTPANPVALKLAQIDPANNVAYIARPGQFSQKGVPNCNPKYWSSARFAPEVINAFSQIIDKLKEKSGAKNIELTGYSGGAAIAIIVAANRNDVVALRTVAGNLDTKKVSNYHKVSQLNNSLNPLDFAPKIAHIPQRHFIGSQDKIIPFTITKSFVEMEGVKNSDSVTIVEGATHSQNWEKHWKELLIIPLNSSVNKSI